MPKRGESSLVITITPDGEVYKNVYDASFKVNQLGEAISVPPHGRLGDLDELENRIKAWMQATRRAMTEDVEPYITAVLRGIQETPTIIPAEETSTEDINIPTTNDLLYEEGGRVRHNEKH